VTRILALIVTLIPCLSLLRDSAAAPVPPGGDKPLYYPTEVGTKWVWEFPNTPGVEPRTLTVSAVKDKDGAKVVTVDEAGADGKTAYYKTMKVSEDGLFLVGDRVNSWESPLCILKLPHKDGAKWEAESITEQKVRTGGTYRDKERRQLTATGPEEVKVPAGTFNAIRVKEVVSSRESTYWYAPGVGMVKCQSESRLGAKQPTISETVLKSFTPAKK
jgi:hypothetical protein